MPLVPLRPLMEAAEAHNYAQGAFNVNAVAQAKAVIEMHETFRSPAILQGADLANAFMGGRVDFANGTLEDKKKGARNIANAVKKYGEHSPIPVVLHLDHGKDFDSCVAAIEGGYTSVMIDGSSLPLGAEHRADPGSGEVRPCPGRVRGGRAGRAGRPGGPRVRRHLHLHQPPGRGEVHPADRGGCPGHLLRHPARGQQGQGC